MKPGMLVWMNGRCAAPQRMVVVIFFSSCVKKCKAAAIRAARIQWLLPGRFPDRRCPQKILLNPRPHTLPFLSIHAQKIRRLPLPAFFSGLCLPGAQHRQSFKCSFRRIDGRRAIFVGHMAFESNPAKGHFRESQASGGTPPCSAWQKSFVRGRVFFFEA